MILMHIIPDEYPLSVQNNKFGSRLYVNADIAKIHQFRQRFVINLTFWKCCDAATLIFFVSLHFLYVLMVSFYFFILSSIQFVCPISLW